MGNAHQTSGFSEVSSLADCTKLLETIGLHIEPIVYLNSLYVNSKERQNRQYMAAPTITRELKQEDPMKVLSALLVRNPKRPVGFFQKSADLGDGFKPLQTHIGFDPVGNHIYKGDEDPFEGLKSLHDLTMGYICYDGVRFREPILNKSAGAFSKLNSHFTTAEFSVFKNFLIFDHQARKLYLRGDVLECETVLNQAQALPARSSVFLSSVELSPEDFRRSLGSDAFKAGVRKLQEHIKAGDIFQAVISERFEIDLTVSPLEIFQTLIEIGSSAYQFFYSTPERIVLGASPELLLSVKGGKLETHPIAGTRPRGKTEAEDLKLQDELMKDTKENAEHLMLVDLARNDLGRISKPGKVHATERNLIKRFPSVMHIVSKVEGELKSEYAPVDALSSCFPAGTLSGAPKIRAMQLISEIEGVPRGFYGGTFFLSQPDGELEACISIRSMEIIGNRGYIQAGAGIVMDSDPDSEYAEVLHKSKTLRRVLALAMKKEGK
jgi:anthranilate/para-aminobenzoate synthase component I